MADEVLKKLLECGVHFGHQTRRWNPKMKRFIFGERSGIYIIDLEKTIEYLNVAREFIRSIAAKGGSVLFVGTKKQAKDVVSEEASRAFMPYINNRWMGGLLTNFQTVRKSIEKLNKIEQMEADGVMANLTKKEASSLLKERAKLLRDLGGIREMKKPPEAIFVIDSKRETIAVKEAARLKIPLVALIDTNCDPDEVDYPIPGNDDALKSIRYIVSILTDTIIEGRKTYLEAEAVRQKAEVGQEAMAGAQPAAQQSPASSNQAVTAEQNDESKAE